MKRNIVLYSLISSWKLLPGNYRKQAILVMFLMLINSVLDIASLASLIPLITVTLEDSGAEGSMMSKFMELTGISEHSQAVLTIGIGVVFFIIFKNVVSILIARNQANFAMNVYRHYALRSFNYYYDKGFTFFQSSNSNEVVRNIVNIPANFANMMLLSLIGLLNELVIALLILISLGWVNPTIIVLLVATVLPTAWLFYTSLKKKIKYYDERRLELLPIMNNNLYQSIFGYAEVIISGTRNIFYKKYKEHVSELKQIQVFSQVLKNAPPKVMETAVMISVVIILIYGVYYFDDRSSLVNLLGIYALAAYRLVPSINRILNYLISVKGYQYCFPYLTPVKDAAPESNMSTDPINFDHFVKLENVSFSYGQRNETVIKDLSMEIRKGEKVGVIGKSGSGKSTLMSLMLGFLEPSQGRITIDGVCLNRSNLLSWQKRIGYVQQEVFLLEGTLAENIAFGLDPKDIDLTKVAEVARIASLDELIRTSEQGLQMPVGERGAMLSGGQRQRIGIARALYKGCDIMFLDEATSALDTETENEINESIRKLGEEGLTMVIIAHRLTTLKHCNKIIQIENGKIIHREVKDVVQ